MNAVELIDAVEARGGYIRMDGPLVVVTPCAAALPFRQQLIEHKREILILVRAREPKPAPALDLPSSKRAKKIGGRRQTVRVDRNTAILYEYENGSTLQKVGDKYHVTRERIRQIVSKGQPMRDRQRAQQEMYSTYIRDFREIVGDREAELAAARDARQEDKVQ